MRTIVVSDLHLGSMLERDVLRRPAALGVLEAAVAGADRLVLLGDTLELLEGRPSAAAAAGRAVLPRLGAALGGEGEVVVVPGNHDHALVHDWIAARREGDRPLRPATQVPKRASELLAELCSWLRPARVRVRYPGVWLTDDVYATHGHFLDRLLGAALLGRLRDVTAGEAPRASVEDFERAPGADAGSVQEALAGALPDAAGAGLGQAFGAARRALLAGLPLLAGMPGAREATAIAALGLEQGIHRRAAIPAMAEVAVRMRVPADHVVFGHIHRRGPLPGDPDQLWRPLGADGPRLWNSGSWVFDSALAGSGGTGATRPYRPGGAIVIETGRFPRAVNLLDDLPDRVLRGRI